MRPASVQAARAGCRARRLAQGRGQARTLGAGAWAKEWCALSCTARGDALRPALATREAGAACQGCLPVAMEPTSLNPTPWAGLPPAANLATQGICLHQAQASSSQLQPRTGPPSGTVKAAGPARLGTPGACHQLGQAPPQLQAAVRTAGPTCQGARALLEVQVGGRVPAPRGVQGSFRPPRQHLRLSFGQRLHAAPYAVARPASRGLTSSSSGRSALQSPGASGPVPITAELAWGSVQLKVQQPHRCIIMPGTCASETQPEA